MRASTPSSISAPIHCSAAASGVRHSRCV